jgi:regulatory protein
MIFIPKKNLVVNFGYKAMPQWNPPKLGEAALWDYAVKALAGRAHSAGQLRLKLQRKAEKQGDIDIVLARLKEFGYLDDKKFAESFANSRLENQQFGKSRVLRDLRERRIAPAMAQRTVAKIYGQVDEPALIESYVRRRYRSATREGLFQDNKEMASAYRKLLRAGFSSGNIVRVLKRFARDPDLLDQWEPPAEIEE